LDAWALLWIEGAATAGSSLEEAVGSEANQSKAVRNVVISPHYCRLPGFRCILQYERIALINSLNMIHPLE
jgi:hypothetical protein